MNLLSFIVLKIKLNFSGPQPKRVVMPLIVSIFHAALITSVIKLLNLIVIFFFLHVHARGGRKIRTNDLDTTLTVTLIYNECSKSCSTSNIYLFALPSFSSS